MTTCDYLPGYVASIGPQVDGIVALDDGSSDGSAEFLESCDEVIKLIRVPRDRPAWDEVGNYRRLVEAGLRHGADWLVSLDADERVEREFRARLEWVIARGRLLGLTSYQLRLRELWDSPDHYRADGIWGEKVRARVFRAEAGCRVRRQAAARAQGAARGGPRPPLSRRRSGALPPAHAPTGGPRARGGRATSERIPDSVWQPGIGYAYLTDENGLRLERIDPARDYVRAEATSPPSA